MGHEDWHPTVLYLLALVVLQPFIRRVEDMMALQEIEQATFDREFWDLVSDAS